MAITPPTDAELLEHAKVRLRLLGVDITTLPTATPNPSNSPTQDAVLQACVTALKELQTFAALTKAQAPYDPVFYGATQLGVEVTADVR
ncbi:MAG: hypothetical protein AB7V42_06075 [Thermoleophilia bacterium]